MRCFNVFHIFSRKVVCCIYEKKHNVSVIRINDGEGVFIDEEIYVCKL